MIANLATTLGMTRAELELELKKSVEGMYNTNVYNAIWCMVASLSD